MFIRYFTVPASISIALSLVFSPVFAQNKPTGEPLLRVETGMHTTMIRRLLVDEAGQRLFTCSDDKTVRVWQMHEGRLSSVIRVPMDHGHEGKLFAIALSPDGKTIATAGWTGWSWKQKGTVYFFDIASGKMINSYDDLANTSSSLNWTSDGKHVLIGLHGQAGFQVLRIADNQIATSDTAYLDSITDMDISEQNKIAVVALDGMIRLYDSNFKLLGRRNLVGGKKPSSVRFSPSGEKLVVSFLDKPAISVFSGEDLSYAYTPDMSDIVEQSSFTTAAWSSNGEYIYAAGDYKGSGKNPLYRWDEQGKGDRKRIPLTTNRMLEIQHMQGDKMAFVAEDPGLGVINEQGETLLYKGPHILNYRNINQDLTVSDDGSTVSYRLRQGQHRKHMFSVLGPGDQDLSRYSDSPFQSAIQNSNNFVINNWKDSLDITVNNKRPATDKYERSRSYAIAPDHKTLLLGTEWSLKLLDTQVNTVWTTSLPAVAWGVTINASGQYALAALSDGTIRWYRMKDGKEILAYFPHNNGKDWIAWIPEGYYSSSIYGDTFVGWQLNRGGDQSPDFFKAVQFDRFLYRPDIVKAAFKSSLNDNKRRSTLSEMGAEFIIDQLRKVAPPRLNIQIKSLNTEISPPLLTLEIVGEKNGPAMRDYILFINNIPITPSINRILKGPESQHFKRTLDVALNSRENNIRLESFNGVSMGVAETFVSLPENANIPKSSGDFYLLAIGANVFPNLPKENYLEFAAQDSEEFSKIVNKKTAACYNRVYSKVLSDFSEEKPERQQILDAMSFINQAKPEDTVAIFLASHGISDPAGNYYFVPRDSEFDDFKKIAEGLPAKTLVSWKIFFDALRNATGRRLLIVDTCQAQDIQGKFESHSLMKRSASSLFSLMVASKGDEYSQEYTPGKHGLFTYSLMNSLKTQSDLDKNGKVSLMELFKSTSQLVNQLRAKSVGPQTPQIIAPTPLDNTPLLCNIN